MLRHICACAAFALVSFPQPSTASPLIFEIFFGMAAYADNDITFREDYARVSGSETFAIDCRTPNFGEIACPGIADEDLWRLNASLDINFGPLIDSWMTFSDDGLPYETFYSYGPGALEWRVSFNDGGPSLGSFRATVPPIVFRVFDESHERRATLYEEDLTAFGGRFDPALAKFFGVSPVAAGDVAWFLSGNMFGEAGSADRWGDFNVVMGTIPVTTAAVPEPLTATLLGIGLALAAVRHRRTRSSYVR